MSDINARQALIDAKVLTLEERLLIIYEQIEQLPEQIKKAITTSQHRSSLPTLVENMAGSSQNISILGNNYKRNINNNDNNDNTNDNSSNDNNKNQSSPKHTFLHPNDAACLSPRPSWSTSNINPSGSGKHYLAPNVLRTTSFDT